MIDPEGPFTKKQGWAIFKITGYDVRDSNLTKEEASDIISGFNSVDFDSDELIKIIEEAGGIKKTEAKPKQDWAKLFAAAVHAGEEAVKECVPTPMVVVERANPLDDSSAIVKQYEPVLDGVCGFASILIRPGNHSFVNFLKKMTENDMRNFGLWGGKHYHGGYSLSVMGYNQSYEKKSAYARAFAKVLTDAIQDEKFMAYAESRLD
jgi:hypothetical protein